MRSAIDFAIVVVAGVVVLPAIVTWLYVSHPVRLLHKAFKGRLRAGRS